MSPTLVLLASAALLSAAPRRATPETLLRDARARYDALDYDQVAPLVQRVLKDDGAAVATTVEALVLWGSVLAITRDVADAEPPFRRALQLMPGLDLPPKTAPKILAAFRKVQVELNERRAAVERRRHAAQVARLALAGGLPSEAQGGRPLALALRFDDPDRAIAHVSVPFRRDANDAFSAIALERGDDGRWRGELPAEATANDSGLKLEYRVETSDADGAALLALGTPEQPLTLDVSKGDARRLLPRGVFLGGMGATLSAGIVTAVLGGLLHQEQQRFSFWSSYAPTHSSESASVLSTSMARGQMLATGTTISLVVTLVLAVATAACGVVVDWSAPDL